MSSASISSSPRDRGSKVFVRRNGHDATRRGELDLLLVDDHLAARYNVWALLRFRRGIRAIHTADTSIQALTLASRHRPHVCLISATLGQGEGLTLASKIKHLMHPPRVLIFADAIDAQLAGAAIVAGADGMLWRYADPEQQAGVLRRAAGGEQHFPNLRSTEVLALLDRVDDRDRAIVAMLLESTHPDEVARTLGISARELKRRRVSIVKLLGHTHESTPATTPNGTRQIN
jgi:DNA-binding NarL/FixJ family response regulator